MSALPSMKRQAKQIRPGGPAAPPAFPYLALGLGTGVLLGWGAFLAAAFDLSTPGARLERLFGLALLAMGTAAVPGLMRGARWILRLLLAMAAVALGGLVALRLASHGVAGKSWRGARNPGAPPSFSCVESRSETACLNRPVERAHAGHSPGTLHLTMDLRKRARETEHASAARKQGPRRARRTGLPSERADTRPECPERRRDTCGSCCCS